MCKDMRRSGLLAASLLALPLTVPAHGQPASAVEAGGGARPTISLQFSDLNRRTGPDGPRTASIHTFSRPGESATLFVWTGTRELRSLCAPGAGLEPAADAAVVWRADATLVSFDAANVTLDMRWSRTVREAGLSDAPAIERSFRIRAQDGQVRTIDLVRALPGIDDNCDGAVVSVAMGFWDSAPLAQALLDYDIWLVDRDREGHETVDHVSSRGLQGRSLDYAFQPFRYGQEGLVASAGTLTFELQGTVRGRVRPDGKIDLVLGVSRTIRKDQDGAGDGGATQATVEPGDAIEFQLPDVPPQLRNADLPSTLRGQHTVIRVQARRVS
jgi:hypothetical protein